METSGLGAEFWGRKLRLESVLFLSQFWVSKWHPKILQWHPKFWKPKYGSALYWSKTIWDNDKHVFLHAAIATDGCNVIGWHNFLAQKLEAKIVSLVSVHCHVYRFGLLLVCYRFAQCGVRNCEITFNAIMKVFYCFTVAIGLLGDASDHNAGKRSAVAARRQTWPMIRTAKTEEHLREVLTQGNCKHCTHVSANA